MLRALCFVLLFTATAHAGDIEGIDLVRSKSEGARADAIKTVRKPVRRGKTALRFEIRPGDCTPEDCAQDRERVELKSDSTETEGNRSRYRWSFFLPRSFQSVWPARQFIAQFHQEGGQPAMLFGLEPEGLVFESRFATEKRLIIPAASLKGRWHDISVEVLWSKGEGQVVIRADGRERYRATQQTMSEDEAYFKIGLYRAHLDRNPEGRRITQIMYVDAIRRD